MHLLSFYLIFLKLFSCFVMIIQCCSVALEASENSYCLIFVIINHRATLSENRKKEKKEKQVECTF